MDLIDNSDMLRRLQLTLVDILKVIDEVCGKYDIHYSLYAGTLLGAVRHKGFIPWDDDLDICMSREDYERFITAWDKEQPEGYILQNKNTDPGFTQTFTKIRKEHTAFLQYDWEIGRYHTGIFVDIFPLDRIPSGKLNRAVFKWRCMKYLLYTREFVPPKASAFTRFVSQCFLKVSTARGRINYRRKFEERLKKYDRHTEWNTIGAESLLSLSQILPSDIMDEYVRLPFESGEYECVKKWDEMLKIKYGDYLQLPPEDQRIWNHNHLAIDFEKDYEELNDERSS